MTADELSVEFGPLEQRGVLLGISAPSLAAIGAGTLLGLATVFTVGGGRGLLLGLAAMAVGLGVGLVPFAGSPVAEWVTVIGGYSRRAVLRRRRWSSAVPTAGVVAVDLPPALARSRMRVVSVPRASGRAAIVLDGPYAIGVLRARSAAAFLMKQPDEQAAATGHWAEVIGSLADPGSPWVRLQWIDCTAPVDTGSLVRFTAEAACPQARVAGTPEHEAAVAYEQLTRRAAPRSESHEILLAAAMDPRRFARQIKDAGGGDEGTALVAMRHLEQLAYKLAGADILVEGQLGPRQVGQLLREHVDPAERQYQSTITAAGDSAMAGVDPHTAWTLAADEGFATHRTDGAWHATLWVKEWPRRTSRLDFLAPLLLRTGSVTRTLSVTMTPVDPATALRQAESTATADESDDALRHRFGIRTSGRRRREAQAAGRREEELLDGYDDVRFSGYVTVSAPTREQLEEAVADVTTHARAARIRLVRLVGQQAEAFWFTAPLCRGVRR